MRTPGALRTASAGPGVDTDAVELMVSDTMIPRSARKTCVGPSLHAMAANATRPVMALATVAADSVPRIMLR